METLVLLRDGGMCSEECDELLDTVRGRFGEVRRAHGGGGGHSRVALGSSVDDSVYVGDLEEEGTCRPGPCATDKGIGRELLLAAPRVRKDLF